MRRPSSAATASPAWLVSTRVPSGACGKRASSAADGRGGPQAKPSPALARATVRSRQSSPARWNCRIGSASKNSFAMTISGPSGSSSTLATQLAAWPASAAAWRARSAGLRSTATIRAAARNPGSVTPARSASDSSVPRPGPSSASTSGSGRPMSDQTCAAQAPSSSPNIWLTSGAVTKSPPAPSGSREP